MIEYQGWATIREAFREQDENETKLVYVTRELAALVDELGQRPWCEAKLTQINGAYRLFIMGNRNHASGDWPEVLALFEWVAENAPGSYGILSVLDDEDAESRNNEFQVFVLRRGTLKRGVDPHLSPYFPMVEELQ